MKAIRVTADKVLSHVEVDTLEEMQAIVGGLIQRLALERGDGSSMYVNEEGKLLALPFNSIATDLALNILEIRDAVVGTVFIVGPGDGNGSDTDIDLDGPTVRFLRTVAREAGGRWVP